MRRLGAIALVGLLVACSDPECPSGTMPGVGTCKVPGTAAGRSGGGFAGDGRFGPGPVTPTSVGGAGKPSGGIGGKVLGSVGGRGGAGNAGRGPADVGSDDAGIQSTDAPMAQGGAGASSTPNVSPTAGMTADPVAPRCGDGNPDPGETCDGNCPVSCDDRDPCTKDVLTGSDMSCSLKCEHSQITKDAGGDGCCLQGHIKSQDADCSLECAKDGDCGAGADGCNARVCNSGKCEAKALTGTECTYSTGVRTYPGVCKSGSCAAFADGTGCIRSEHCPKTSSPCMTLGCNTSTYSCEWERHPGVSCGAGGTCDASGNCELPQAGSGSGGSTGGGSSCASNADCNDGEIPLRGQCITNTCVNGACVERNFEGSYCMEQTGRCQADGSCAVDRPHGACVIADNCGGAADPCWRYTCDAGTCVRHADVGASCGDGVDQGVCEAGGVCRRK